MHFLLTDFKLNPRHSASVVRAGQPHLKAHPDSSRNQSQASPSTPEPTRGRLGCGFAAIRPASVQVSMVPEKPRGEGFTGRVSTQQVA